MCDDLCCARSRILIRLLVVASFRTPTRRHLSYLKSDQITNRKQDFSTSDPESLRERIGAVRVKGHDNINLLCVDNGYQHVNSGVLSVILVMSLETG